MKLSQLKLEHFRGYNEETVVEFDDLTVLIGKNDSGKSSVFDALNIFFEVTAVPDKDDLCVYSSDDNISITCVFREFPSQLIMDAQHPTDLASEHLLNDYNLLDIIKIYNCSLAKPKLSNIVARAVHPTADQYDDLLSLTNANLKQRAKSLGVDLYSVNQSVNSDLRRAIWAHADDLQAVATDVSLFQAEGKKVWDQIKKSLPIYALFKSDRPSTDQDAEAQDPMKSAVKEAIRTQEEELSRITKTVVKEVQEVATRTVEKIQEMNPELANELTPHVSTRNWDTLFSVNLTGDEDIPINKRGSGTRRLVLLNFFRAKTEKDAEGTNSGLIYAIEEPETSQHPHNQVILVNALQDLTESAECQVFMSTHTPVLARRFNQDALRLVTKESDRPVIRNGREESTIRDIVDSLGVLPDHSVKAFLGVEGTNDISFLKCISKILHAENVDIPDLGEEEETGRLVFVPLGGSSLELWVSKFQEFELPEFYWVDRDNPPPQQAKYQGFVDEIVKLGNCSAWITNRKELENYLHPQVISDSFPDYAGTGDRFEDVPELFARAVHEASESNVDWQDVRDDTEKLGKKVSRAKRRLNSEFVAKMTPSLLSAIDTEHEVQNWLMTIGAALQEEQH
ncbi:MAG: ATP-binding protein [Chloroflexi bacterium]|nr:ATP-binding protein [Chloroflexota bacterium]